MNRNFTATAEALQLGCEELIQLARNSFIAAFASADQKQQWLKAIDEYVAGSAAA